MASTVKIKHEDKSKKVNVGSGANHRKRKVSRIQLIAIAAVVGLIGIAAIVHSFAATGNIYLLPASTSVQVNSTFTAALRITPGGNTDGAQATITYDPTKLQFVSVDATGSQYSVSLQQTTTSNSITIVRALSYGDSPITTDALIANISFKALAGSGTSNLTLSNANSTYDGAFLSPASASSTITFMTPPPPTATFTNVTASSIISTDLSAATGTTNTALVSATYGVSVVPVDNSGTGVKQVDLQLDAGAKQTLTSGFNFSVNMSALNCGSHTLTATVTDNQSTPKTGTATVTFKATRSADVNGNCTVDLSDYNAVRSNFGLAAAQLTDPRIDINRTGSVDLSDYSGVRTRYGTTIP